MGKATDIIDVYEEFQDLYYKNKIAARVKYDSKKVCISGKIQNIDSNRDLIYVEMQFYEKITKKCFGSGPGDCVTVYLYFDQNKIKDVIKLRNGKNATLEGEFNVYQTQVWANKAYVSHCKVIDCETD